MLLSTCPGMEPNFSRGGVPSDGGGSLRRRAVRDISKLRAEREAGAIIFVFNLCFYGNRVYLNKNVVISLRLNKRK